MMAFTLFDLNFVKFNITKFTAINAISNIKPIDGTTPLIPSFTPNGTILRNPASVFNADIIKLIPKPKQILNIGLATVAVIAISPKPRLAISISLLKSSDAAPSAIRVIPKYATSISPTSPIRFIRSTTKFTKSQSHTSDIINVMIANKGMILGALY